MRERESKRGKEKRRNERMKGKKGGRRKVRKRRITFVLVNIVKKR